MQEAEGAPVEWEPWGSVCVQGFPVCPRERSEQSCSLGCASVGSTSPADVTSHPMGLGWWEQLQPWAGDAHQGRSFSALVALSGFLNFLFIYFILAWDTLQLLSALFWTCLAQALQAVLVRGETPDKVLNHIQQNNQPSQKTPTKDSCGTDPGHGVLEAQQWYSNLLFSQGGATYMLVFSFPTSNQDFRNGHRFHLQLFDWRGQRGQEVGELEKTSPIHQKKNVRGGFSFLFLPIGLFWHIWTLTVVPCMGWALASEKLLSFGFLIIWFFKF